MKLKKAVFTSFTILCLLSTLLLMGYKTSVKASPDVIYVPTDFPTIQEAISHANSGDTIFVYSGTYYEHVVIDKSISLIGEDRNSTIIDGGGTGRVISVTANNVNVNGFTIQKSGRGLYDSGVLVDHSSGNDISDNTIKNNYHGIYLYSSSDNTVSGNNVSSNNYHGIYLDHSSNNTVSANSASSNNYHGIYLHTSTDNTVSANSASNNTYGICLYSSRGNVVSGNDVSSNNTYGIHLCSSSNNVVWGNNASSNYNDGIYLDHSSNNTVSANSASNNYHGIRLYSSSDNTVSGNNISNNDCGIRLYSSSNNNTIYHNNFINKIDQVWSDSVNFWNDGKEGNYWSDYTGQDPNGDGIGDTPYVIDVNNQDNYPLMGMFSDFKVAWKEETYHVTTVCNSTISDFRFEIGRETGNKMISFNVTGGDDTVGFCRVMIPTHLMNYSYIVLVDGEEIIPTLLDASSKTHVCLYFTYVHSSRTVTIISSKLLYLYNELLDKHAKLQIDFDGLNSTYHELLNNYGTLLDNYSQLLESYDTLNLTSRELLDNYGTLLGNYSQLLERYGTLNASYQEHLLDYSELQGNHTSLLLEHAQNIRSLIYVFIATTTIFIVAAAYLSTHAHKKVSRS